MKEELNFYWKEELNEVVQWWSVLALALKELREGFNKEKTGKRAKLLLTMAVPAGFDTIENGFDIRSLNRYTDMIVQHHLL